MIVYRPMKTADIPAGLSLCRMNGWNQLARDWELFLKLGPAGCRVAVDDEGRVVGTVTTLTYDHFSWIGMVLVDPAMQKRGIGGQLLQESLHILNNEKVVKLDATKAGREVYLKLGFVDEYLLSRMHWATPAPSTLPPSKARPLDQSDFPQLLALDAEIFGTARSAVLEWIREGAPQYAFVIEERNHIKGYCFGRRGHLFTQIGPVIAADYDGAVHLVSAALQHCSGPVILDAAHHTPEWIKWLSSIGFVEQRQLTRMYRGPDAGPGIPEKQFAILGPEFG